MSTPAEQPEQIPVLEPLPVRDPGATIRDNPIPDWHHAYRAFGDD